MGLLYFKASEFGCPEGTDICMSREFIEKLDKARGIAGVSFKLNSAYRTPEHNAEVGGKPDSAHCKGLAVDIHCIGSRERFLILCALIEVGFTRIGIAKTFIHVDDDKSKDPEVVWLYT